MTDTAEIVITALVATLNGEDYPVDLAEITLEQVARFRTAPLHVDLRFLPDLINASQASVLEAVALVALSLEQQDLPADPLWLMRHTPLDSEFELTAITPDA